MSTVNQFKQGLMYLQMDFAQDLIYITSCNIYYKSLLILF